MVCDNEEQIFDRDLMRRTKESVVHNRDRKTTVNDEIVKSSMMIVDKHDDDNDDDELCNNLHANNRPVWVPGS